MRHVVIILLAVFENIWCSDWNYENHGPDFWTHEYPQCKGNLQSPINIEHSKAIFDSNLGHVLFHNYEKLLQWRIVNTGLTITGNQINNESVIPFITSSSFKSDVKYYLMQFHFHWGFNIYQGSEHHIDLVKYPLEIHLVHKSKFNETTVLSFLFQISKEDNEKLNPLIKQIGLNVAEEDSHETSFSLDTIIPNTEMLKTDGFYRYLGSLTTPPCTEGVKWTVFRTKINISQLQMMEFYKNEIDFNNREVQQLNDRILTINVENTKNGESIIKILLNRFRIFIKNIFEIIKFK